MQDQFVVRRALEKALGSGSSSYETNEPSTVPKVSAVNFPKEISFSLMYPMLLGVGIFAISFQTNMKLSTKHSILIHGYSQV